LEIEKLGAQPVIGSVEDQQFIVDAFAGADAVYLMIPPSFSALDVKQYIRQVGTQYAHAIRENGVKHVVNLSSVGSHAADGLGPTGANYFVEQQLNTLPDVNVLHLRPGMFMTNFFGAMDMIRHQGMLGNNFDGTVALPLTHPRDIAEAVFEALDNLSFSGKSVRYVVGDVKTGADIADALGNAVGKPDVRWAAFTDQQLLTALMGNGFSEQMATVYMVEIGKALREGSFMTHFHKQASERVGKTSLVDFAKEFAFAYHAGAMAAH
jgi:uncharacterized protein YbjT (DUF2867 family)